VMGLQETKEPGALGEARKQRPIVTRQPAIEGPVAHAGSFQIPVDSFNEPLAVIRWRSKP